MSRSEHVAILALAFSSGATFFDFQVYSGLLFVAFLMSAAATFPKRKERG